MQGGSAAIGDDGRRRQARDVASCAVQHTWFSRFLLEASIRLACLISSTESTLLTQADVHLVYRYVQHRDCLHPALDFLDNSGEREAVHPGLSAICILHGREGGWTVCSQDRPRMECAPTVEESQPTDGVVCGALKCNRSILSEGRVDS